MSYSYTNPTNRIRARKLLATLIVQARIEADSKDLEMQTGTAIAGAVAYFITEDKIDGIHIYAAPLGGWHADITLKDMPPGISDVLGTPVSSPCATRQEALDQAVLLLTSVIFLCRQKKGKLEDGFQNAAPFEMDGVPLPVPMRFIELIQEAGIPKESVLVKQLDEVRKGGMTADRLNRMTKDEKIELMTVCAMALSLGIHRWPERPHGQPSTGVMQ